MWTCPPTILLTLHTVSKHSTDLHRLLVAMFIVPACKVICPQPWSWHPNKSYGLQANSKADNNATLPPPDSADAHDLKQAGLVKAQLTGATPLQHWVDYKQERVRSLEARLEQAEHSREYHRQVRAYPAEQLTTEHHNDKAVAT